jgi:hypothetical protein
LEEVEKVVVVDEVGEAHKRVVVIAILQKKGGDETHLLNKECLMSLCSYW